MIGLLRPYSNQATAHYTCNGNDVTMYIVNDEPLPHYYHEHVFGIKVNPGKPRQEQAWRKKTRKY